MSDNKKDITELNQVLDELTDTVVDIEVDHSSPSMLFVSFGDSYGSLMLELNIDASLLDDILRHPNCIGAVVTHVNKDLQS